MTETLHPYTADQLPACRDQVSGIVPSAGSIWHLVGVMVHFMYQLVWAMVLRYLVQHYSGCFWDDVRERLTFKRIELWVKQIALHLGESHRKKGWPPGNRRELSSRRLCIGITTFSESPAELPSPSDLVLAKPPTRHGNSLQRVSVSDAYLHMCTYMSVYTCLYPSIYMHISCWVYVSGEPE